ncbi:hypothetical protein [Vibrio sp.]|uniref:hypothetical protein n=1 Tax=Vibrio sp. TaxID=678 RepID=UPI003D111BFA
MSSDLRNALISGQSKQSLKKACRQRRRIKNKIINLDLVQDEIFVRIATKFNRLFQDQMISIEVYGYTQHRGLVKLGEQFYAEKNCQDLGQCLCILCARVIYKWMLQDRRVRLEINGFTGLLAEELLKSFFQIDAIEIGSSCYKKQETKFLQLTVDDGGELRENSYLVPLRALESIHWPYLASNQ